MAWQDVPAFSTTTGRAMISAYLSISKAGQTKLNLLMSPFVSDKLGDPETVGMQFGSGEHSGQIRVIAGKAGKGDAPGGVHKVTNGFKGGKRVLLPWFEGLPKGAAKAVPCSIIHEGPGELIVKLPIADWEIAISQAQAAALPKSGFAPRLAPAVTTPASTPAPAGARIPIPAAPAPAPPSGRLNMVEYLAGKGLKVARLAGGLFMVSGERVEAQALLELVNSHRKRSDLPQLAMREVE